MLTRSPLLDPQALQDVGEALHLGQQLGVGDDPAVARLALPVEGHLVAPPGLDVAVEAVVGHVELAADEPLGEGQLPLADGVPLLRPVHERRPPGGPRSPGSRPLASSYRKVPATSDASLKPSGGGNVRFSSSRSSMALVGSSAMFGYPLGVRRGRPESSAGPPRAFMSAIRALGGRRRGRERVRSQATSHSATVKPPRPAGSVSASASRTRLRAAARRGRAPPACAAHVRRPSSTSSSRPWARRNSAWVARRGRRGGSWSRATSLVMSCVPGIGQVVPAPLVVAVGPQPLPPRPRRHVRRRRRVVDARRAARAAGGGPARRGPSAPASLHGRSGPVRRRGRQAGRDLGERARAPRRAAPPASTSTKASRHPPSCTARRKGRLSSSSLATTTPDERLVGQRLGGRPRPGRRGPPAGPPPARTAT